MPFFEKLILRMVLPNEVARICTYFKSNLYCYLDITYTTASWWTPF